MIGIHLEHLGKRFDGSRGSKEVLRDLTLTVRPGEVIVFRGDNGTGKTTLLNVLVGIEPATTGSIRFSHAADGPVRVGYVQQDYTSSLLPWFDVRENVAVPLRLAGIGKKERSDRADKLLENLGFTTLPRDAYPYQLSGGQKQRVALARALIHEPHLLILDEPFANLDAHSTRDLQETISEIHQTKGPTILYVSHDLDQIFLADRVLVLHGSPAAVAAEFDLPLKRPRHRTMILADEYVSVRAKILSYEETLYAQQ